VVTFSAVLSSSPLFQQDIAHVLKRPPHPRVQYEGDMFYIVPEHLVCKVFDHPYLCFILRAHSCVERMESSQFACSSTAV
jgi:hypothetical protein